MKTISLILLIIIGVFGVWKYISARNSIIKVNSPKGSADTSILDQCIKKLNSKDELCLRDFKGKKILLVNVASECGFTKQYADLEKLYTLHKDNLVIIGLPCNQFGGQEPGTEVEIDQFCKSKYEVTFPLTTKIDVKGEDQHPIYKWLTTESLNGIDSYKVNWNFNKFLLNENGQLIGYFGSRINPLDSAITNLLK